MKRWTLAAIFFIVTTLPASAQVMKVSSEEDNSPIENVYIFNTQHNVTATTDTRGEADISRFSASDTLVFQHPSFQRLALSYTAVEKQNFQIQLVERAFEMNEIFVSASKRKQQRSEIPRKIESIGQEEIEFYQPQTSADLLESKAKVFVQKSQLGGGSPMIRGFAANSVLLSMDGIRINNAIFRSGNLQNVLSVDPQTVQSSEIIYGPGSIIYGSDALGGVMNFKTEEVELSYTDELISSGTAMTRYSSANDERTVHLDLKLGGKNWGTYTSVSYSRFDDLRTGSQFDDEYDWGKRHYYVVRDEGQDYVVPNRNVTHQTPSGYKQLHLMQKVRYKPAARLDLTYTGYLSTTSDIPRYDRLIQWENFERLIPVNAEWYYGPQQWMIHYLDATYNAVNTSLFDQVSLKAGYQGYEESRNDREYRSFWLRNRTENVDVITSNLDFDKRWGEQTSLFYGLESVYNYVTSDAQRLNIETGATAPTGTRYPDGGSDYTQLAGYMKLQHKLNQDLDLILGGRYSHVMLESRFQSEQFYDFPFNKIEVNTGALNGSAGLTYHPGEDLQVSVNASSGFRAPNVDDVAKVFDSEPGSVVMPNEDVGPEYAYNLDAGIIKQFGDILRFQIDGYYTWLHNAMVRRHSTFNGQDSIMYDGTLSQVEKVVNAGEAFVYGGSASLEADFHNDLTAYTSLTLTEGEEIQEGAANIPLRHVPPTYGQSGVRYSGKRLQTEISVRYNAHKPLSDFSPSERDKPHMYTDDGTPSWYTINVNASYRVNEHFSVSAAAENLMDTHYRPYSSGISAPGRHVDMTVRASF